MCAGLVMYALPSSDGQPEIGNIMSYEGEIQGRRQQITEQAILAGAAISEAIRSSNAHTAQVYYSNKRYRCTCQRSWVRLRSVEVQASSVRRPSKRHDCPAKVQGCQK